MVNIKVLKDPGFLYDLNYIFYLKFNIQYCIDQLAEDNKKEENVKYLKETLQHFGDISDDLYVFYHALDKGRCFMTRYYLKPYKEKFSTEFNFKYFRNLLSDTDRLCENLIRFYLHELSEEQLAECAASTERLFFYIKQSKYSCEEKSKLYEFFINPKAYIQALQYELMDKEVILSAYYKDNYEKLLEAHNNTTFETLNEQLKDVNDLSFLKEGNQVLYTSYCLLNKYFLMYMFLPDGVIYLLGYDYASIINVIKDGNQNPPLENMCSALGEASRVQIMELLLERDEIICKDLEKVFDFSGSTAYHHISILTKIGAVKFRSEGKTIYYSLNRKYFDTLRDVLKKFSND